MSYNGGSLLGFMGFDPLTRIFEFTPPDIIRYDVTLRGTDEIGKFLDLPVIITI